ncbi:MAG: class I SAM-dependent methyltransferase [Candidatus Wallbacteria bacterium]|nr:class I SAM-dependent methyltransferase [Candidatus Wallbacteria bacterium]
MTSPGPRTDYEQIAPDYDRDRQEYDSFDDELAALLAGALNAAEAAGAPRLLADVGCGTGTLLSRFEQDSCDAYQWKTVGFDPSRKMLSVAKGKVFSGALAAAAAERLPLRDGSAGCVLSTFAFHHFHDFAAFLAQARRVLAPGGRLLLRNILPREGPEPLMYRFFPGAREIDSRRFPLRAPLLESLVAGGFVLEQSICTERLYRFTAERYLELCRKRTISQLHLLIDENFRRGMAAIESYGREHSGEMLEERIPVHTFVAARA